MKFYQLGMIKKIKAQVKPMWSGRVNIIPVLRAISPWVTPLLCDYIGSKMCLPHVLPHLLRPILGALVSKTAKCEILRPCGDPEEHSSLSLLFLCLFNAFRVPWRRHVGLVRFIPRPFRGLPGSSRTVKLQPRLLQQSSVAQRRSVRLHSGKSSILQRLT